MKGFLHDCPHCAGGVFIKGDPYVGVRLACLQCGHVPSRVEERALRAMVAALRCSAA